MDTLGDDLLRGITDIMTVSENTLLEAIKKLAVQPVARGVRRTELINMTQDSGEPIRSFHAKVKGRAATCSYTCLLFDYFHKFNCFRNPHFFVE